MSELSCMIFKSTALVLSIAVAGCAGDNDYRDHDSPPVMTAVARCDQLAQSAFKDTNFKIVSHNSAGKFTAPDGKEFSATPAFCRVAATLKPTADSNIDIEVWLPSNDWNGRYIGLGNGGFAGSIDYVSLIAGIKRGYAVAHTDMGTARADAGGGAISLAGHPEKIIDWGHRSTHLMTLIAKDLVGQYYSKSNYKSYFMGCSTGGGQGIHEAQRYPSDYDGILVGAPANNRVATHTSLMWSGAAPRVTPEAGLPFDKILLLHKSVVAACDPSDGVVDGIISRPELCDFNPNILQCVGGDDGACLSASQTDTVRRLYQGPINKNTGESIFAGQAKGSELGWLVFTYPIPPSGQVLYDDLFYWVFGPSFSWRNFDYGGDFVAAQNVLSSNVDATSPDLASFKNLGGKIILYQGLADQLIPPGQVVRYLDAVSKGTGQVSDFMRLFNVPGMTHCAGGSAPNIFGQNLDISSIPGNPEVDILSALERWVESGVAPEKVLASQYTDNDLSKGNVVRTRPLCVYPKIARYTGHGDTNSAESFTCENPS